MPTLSGEIVSWFHLKARPKSRGDLETDEGDWLCLQCGTYYYTGLYGDKGLSVTKHPNLAPEAPGNTGNEAPSNEAPSKVEQGGRSVPDKPPDDQKKGLNWDPFFILEELISVI